MMKSSLAAIVGLIFCLALTGRSVAGEEWKGFSTSMPGLDACHRTAVRLVPTPRDEPLRHQGCVHSPWSSGLILDDLIDEKAEEGESESGEAFAVLDPPSFDREDPPLCLFCSHLLSISTLSSNDRSAALRC
jgi:hypothetical protein